mmetsp:Transcript_30323/g.29638  ORF Transcript_30323/g.29638 Transcript_30323/m.29638 type:complete len:92 (-) Transcript_30323:840-1115(-)
MGYVEQQQVCKYCYKGTYSLDTEDITCSTCPEFMHCNGGADIVPYPGYWRVGNDSVNIYNCLAVEACLNDGKDECQEGYTGTLCSKCVGRD